MKRITALIPVLFISVFFLMPPFIVPPSPAPTPIILPPGSTDLMPEKAYTSEDVYM
jgi:hypothetical protein